MEKSVKDIERYGERAVKNFDKKRKIFLTKAQIEYGKVVFNKETRVKEFEPYVYKDYKAETLGSTKENEPYVHIKLPSVNNRKICHGEKAYSFGKTKDGINLDDRKPYIQIPLGALVDYTMPLLMEFPQLNNGMQWNVNNPKANFTVYFKANRIGTLPNGKGEFEKLPKIIISSQDLYSIFPTSKEQIRKLQKAHSRKVIKTKGKQKDKGKSKDLDEKAIVKKRDAKRKDMSRER